jgi:hypothetical protein
LVRRRHDDLHLSDHGSFEQIAAPYDFDDAAAAHACLCANLDDTVPMRVDRALRRVNNVDTELSKSFKELSLQKREACGESARLRGSGVRGPEQAEQLRSFEAFGKRPRLFDGAVERVEDRQELEKPAPRFLEGWLGLRAVSAKLFETRLRGGLRSDCGATLTPELARDVFEPRVERVPRRVRAHD